MGVLRVSRSARGARSVSALYGVLSALLLVAALVMALIVRPPPPPSIAALGPSPQEQIEEARENQAAGAGDAAVATSPEEAQTPTSTSTQAGPSATPTTTPPTSSDIKVPATRRCFGDPPRQTEDPHSPPCVFEIFEGDNGGDTATGVTATEVRVAVDNCYLEDTNRAFEALVEHFNRRYEFYGRRIFLDYIDVGDCQAWWHDPSASQAVAQETISQKPFASVIEANVEYQGDFHRDLAQAGIHSLVFAPVWHSSELVDGWTWLVSPGGDIKQQVAADVVCGALRGRTARHAGDGVKGKARKFAVIAGTFKHTVYPDVSPLVKRLDACGANAGAFKIRHNPGIQGTQELDQQIKKMKDENYTTLILIASGVEVMSGLASFARKNNYSPEWFVPDNPRSHTEWYWGNDSNGNMWGQASQAFGLTSVVRVRPFEQTPAIWALNEGGESGNILQWFNIEPFYKKLLVLASGIQGAGPRLTPDSFRRALWETVWPNPNPGGSPYWQQRISLGPGDPVFYDDYALWWWNVNAPQQTPGNEGGHDGRGSFCYLDRGGRYMAGEFPNNADGRFFHDREPCR